MATEDCKPAGPKDPDHGGEADVVESAIHEGISSVGSIHQHTRGAEAEDHQHTQESIGVVRMASIDDDEEDDIDEEEALFSGNEGASSAVVEGMMAVEDADGHSIPVARRARKTELDRIRRHRVRDMINAIKTKPREQWTDEEAAVFEQEQARKARKRERQNKRRSEERDALQRVLETPEEDRTDADKAILLEAEQKRPQATQQKRERQMERRRRADEISAKDKSERTPEETEFLQTFQAQRWRKVEGDRVRRLRTKLQKEGKSPEKVELLVLESRRAGLRKKLQEEGKVESEIEVALLALGEQVAVTATEKSGEAAGNAVVIALAAAASEQGQSGIHENRTESEELGAVGAVNRVLEVSIDGDNNLPSASPASGQTNGGRAVRQHDFKRNREAEMARIQAIPLEERTADERIFFQKATELMEQRREAEIARRAKRKTQGASSTRKARKTADGLEKKSERETHEAVLEANNVRARARYSVHMQRVQEIKRKPKEQWTNEETSFVTKQEERIARKNALSKQRRMEQKQELARILGKPEGERTPEETEYLYSKTKNRMQKIEGDRLRRLQYKNVLRQTNVSQEIRKKAARAVLGRNLEEVEEAAKRRKVSTKKTIRDELMKEADDDSTTELVRKAVQVDEVATTTNAEMLKAKTPDDLIPEEKGMFKKAKGVDEHVKQAVSAAIDAVATEVTEGQHDHHESRKQSGESIALSSGGTIKEVNAESGVTGDEIQEVSL